MMYFAPITKEQRKYVEKDINFDKIQMQKKIEQLKEWIKKEPHLPDLPEKSADNMLFTFLIGTKMSTEKAKRKIDTYYTMRHQLQYVFQDRDPTLKSIRDSLDTIPYFFLPELTPDGVRVIMISFKGHKDRRFSAADLEAMHRRVMFGNDIRQQEDELCCGIYIIMDVCGMYLSHVTELPWLKIQKFTAFVQEGLPTRIKGCFVINAPSFFETCYNFVKPAIKEKIRKRIHIFHGDHTNLYKFMPQRILPSDFGGEAPSIEECNRSWHKIMESHRDFLIEDEKRITDEAKRPIDSVNNYGQIFGINGTFNKLNID